MGRGHSPAMSGLTRISEHVYWMAPGPPDRPSLCAVVGERRSVMLDAGSSNAHTREFLDALWADRAVRPTAVVYTHSHWDHVLGGAELSELVIAHVATAEALLELAARDWSDEGIEGRVAAGLASREHAENVKQELPSPRIVDVAPADIVFYERLDIHLGGATIHVRHVGGDHSTDSSVMYVEPDSVLFLGDCLCEAPRGTLTAELALPLSETVLGFNADLYVEGHHESVSSRAEIEALIAKMRFAETAVREGLATPDMDEDTDYFVRAFRAGTADS